MRSESKSVLDEEREFNFNELFFSTTDTYGKITSWNEVFARISGYDNAQLLNKPHSLIRHPDMPRAVFQLLWDMLKSGEVVGAYVKNRAEDGRFYWVYALVLPIENGYLSIRLKPSSDLFSVVKPFYAELLEYENELIASGRKKSEAAILGKEKLLKGLATLGFEDYRAFMRATLPSEICSRQEQIKTCSQDTQESKKNSPIKSIRSKSREKIKLLENDLNQLFKDLTKSLDLADTIKSNFKETHSLAGEIKRGAINATIEASRLGSRGETLFVLADYLGTNGTTTISELISAEKICFKSLSNVSDILFEVCAAKLQTEILSSFLDEFENEDNESVEMAVDPLKVLSSCFKMGIYGMASRYKGIEHAFASVLAVLEDLRLLFVSLKIAHVSAKTESSRIENADRFGQVFDEVCSVVEHGRSVIDQTTTRLEGYIALLRIREFECNSLLRHSETF